MASRRRKPKRVITSSTAAKLIKKLRKHRTKNEQT